MSANFTDRKIGIDGAVYDCLSDFLDAANMPKARIEENQEHADYWNQNRHGSVWMGLPNGTLSSTAGVTELIRSGWQDGLQRVNDSLGSIAPDIAQPLDLRRKTVWGEQGDELDIHRVYCGQLASAWRKQARPARRSVRHISLGVDCLILGNISAEVLFWRGAAVIRLCDLLTEFGYIVSVVSGFRGRTVQGHENLDCVVTVKQPDQPVSLSDLAACTALPAFFRSVGHRWIAIHAARISGSSGVHARGVNLTMADYVASGSITSLASASTWILDVVAKINSTETIGGDSD